MLKAQLFQQTYFTPAIFLVDSYKIPHRDMYPDGMELLWSTWTPRSDKIAIQAQRQLPLAPPEIIFFGLSMAIQKLTREYGAWFRRDTDEVIEEYINFVKLFLKVDTDGAHIRELHEHGEMPLRIFALPEGTVTKTGVCQLVIFNTGGPQFAWFTNYVESVLSTLMWKPATSANIARNYRTLSNRFADLTCEDNGHPHIQWQQHDFSFRGLSGVEDSESSAIGHLLFFNGTDTVPSLFAANAMYHDFNIGDYGSVPATEHSVMCAWGKDDELETFSRLLDKYPEGILSVVSDTWDFWHVLTNILPALKDKIMARNGKLVIRPDSGDPIKIINGDPDAPFGSPAHWGAVKLLGDVFGYAVNSKGFRELDSHIGLIYGDSITLDRAEAIYTGLARNEWAANNVVLGIGSYTYQATTRDVWGFAMKATAIKINGEEIPIFKDPKTDDGIKKSFKGFCTTRVIDGEYRTVDGLSFAEACDLSNSAFVEYPVQPGAYAPEPYGHGLNNWPAIKARAEASLQG